MRIERLAALLVLLGGCFSPIYPEGLRCAEGESCPPGQGCVVGFCRSPDEIEPGDGGTIDGEPSKSCTAENALPAGASLRLLGTTTGGPRWNRPGYGLFEDEVVCPASQTSDGGTAVPRQAYTFCNPGGPRRFDFILTGNSLQDPFLTVYEGAGVPADTAACLAANGNANGGTLDSFVGNVIIPSGGLVTVVVSGYENGDEGSFELRIEEQVMPTLDVAARRAGLAEGTTASAMVVRLVPPATEPITVAIQEVEGSAGSADRTVSAATLTFAPGETEHAVQVTAVDDGESEPEETLQLRLGTVSGARLGARTGTTVSIHDGDTACDPIVPGVPLVLAGTTQGAPTFKPPTGTCPTPGLATGTRAYETHGFCDRTMTARRVAVQLDGLDEDATLTHPDPQLVLYNGSALPTAVTDCLRMNNDGQGTTAGALAIIDLAPGQNLLTVATGAGTTTGSYRLRVSDLFASFAAPATSVPETAEFVDLPITLSLPAPAAVRFGYVLGGTATADADYALAAGQLEVPAGATSVILRVPILVDDIDEADETVVVRLVAPEGIVLGQTLHTLTILDDDPTPLVEFGAPSSMVTEGTSAVVPVKLSAKSQQTVTVMYLVTGGGATGSGIDYVLWPGMLSFAPGVDAVDLLVPIESDGRAEAPETLVLGLINPANAELGPTTTHTLTLVDP